LKLALVAVPRTGSNYLFDKLIQSYPNYDYISEPYSVYRNQYYINVLNVANDFLYKSLVYQNPTPLGSRGIPTETVYVNKIISETGNFPNEWEWSDNTVIDFNTKLQEHYDKIIYLDGDDLDRITRSFQIALITNEWRTKTDYTMEYPSSAYRISKEKDYIYWYNWLKQYQTVLKSFAGDDNYFTYEGLYKTLDERDKLNEYLGLEIDWS